MGSARFKLVHKFHDSAPRNLLSKPKENDDGDLADFSSSFSFLNFSYILPQLWSPTEGHLFPGNSKQRHLSA
jgi:hypothetical protein